MPQHALGILHFNFDATLYVLIAILLSLSAILSYRLFLHPLARVPGPHLAAITNAWYAFHVRNGRMLSLGKTLHERYGPVVRVGPNEVWFNSIDAFKTIYGSSNGFEKSDFYLATALHRPKIVWKWPLRLTSPDTLDFLSDRNMQRYRLQRRLIGPTYQTSNLKKYEPVIDEVLRKVIAQIKTLKGEEVDLKEWMHIIVVECLGAIVLSWSPGYLRDKSDRGSGSHSYIAWRKRSVFGLFPPVVHLETYSGSLGRLLSNIFGVTYQTPNNFKPFFPGVHNKVTRRLRAFLGANRPKNMKYDDLLDDLIQLHKSKPEFTETYLRRLAVTNFGAGHETMSSALTSVLAMIGSHLDVQSRVAAEIYEAGHSISYDACLRLSYTIACVKEAQRLYPAIGMSLPRTVPSIETGLHLHGYHIPPGTTVGCNPVSLHRNTNIFGTDAALFNPTRWLDTDETARRKMERYNLTWGGGARTCPGRHLAELIVYKAVPALLSEFDLDIILPPEKEIPYYFMAMLAGVKVRFVARSN